jgi:hypothetical protein
LRLNNKGAESLAQEPRFTEKSKYIDIRHFYIRDNIINKRKMIINHIFSINNIANAFIKALLSTLFERYKGQIRLLERAFYKKEVIKKTYSIRPWHI